VTFILRRQERVVIRTWKANVWGLGGDPRLIKQLEMEIKMVKNRYILPVREIRRRIKKNIQCLISTRHKER
jgi:hypothetical protein